MFLKVPPKGKIPIIYISNQYLILGWTIEFNFAKREFAVNRYDLMATAKRCVNNDVLWKRYVLACFMGQGLPEQMVTKVWAFSFLGACFYTLMSRKSRFKFKGSSVTNCISSERSETPNNNPHTSRLTIFCHRPTKVDSGLKRKYLTVK